MPSFGYRVVATVPHDPQAFTQGLLFDRDRFFESTGLRGRSTLREIDPANGRVLRRKSLPEAYFGEGLALYDGDLYQLTWQGRVGFVYRRRDLELLGTFSYPTEGWGLTHNGLYFIQSDGSDKLYFRTFDTFQLHHTLDVRENGRPITRINELEYIHGQVWANIWMTQRLAIIDPETGRVEAWVDLGGLVARASDGLPDSVLNGIAHDPGQDRLWVTGKRWSLIFEIQLIPPASKVPSSIEAIHE
ncbi:MAG: glutaminyl-peptide cyclotransferase [Desulfobacterales bacterium]